MIFGANATISVFHLVLGTKIDNYPAQADLSGVEAYIESQKAELAQVLGDQNNIETFLMYCDPITLATGDKVTDDRGREFRVIGVERHDANGDVDDMIKVIMNLKNR